MSIRIPVPGRRRFLISGLRVRPGRFRVRGEESLCTPGRGCRPADPLGATVSFTLKRDAAVSLTLRRACDRRMVTRFVRQVRAGTMWRSFSDATNYHSLAPGRYTLTAVATSGTTRVRTGSVPKDRPVTGRRGRRAVAGRPRSMATGIATLIVAIAAAAALSASAVAAPPRLVAGWPRNVAAGTVHQGPGGGLVVISIGDVTLEQGAQTVSAFRRDGRRLWSARRAPGCGNCDDGPQPAVLQADDTYGPIGIEGDDFWAVDAGGRIVTGCAGVVYPDGACVVGGPHEAAALQTFRRSRAARWAPRRGACGTTATGGGTSSTSRP